ncbi:hypothetical protein EDB86DRAFT_2838449 [Lactarius hatsudake]|nr:hypothetical protein EDB86DRAFT_2838449 [Lactarius hatsudake]
MYTIDHTEQALRQCRQDERTLLRYNIAVLRELCAKNGIEVDGGSSRPLKKPYIKALLSHSQGSHKNTEQTGLKIRLPYFLPPINKKQDHRRRRRQKPKTASEAVRNQALWLWTHPTSRTALLLPYRKAIQRIFLLQMLLLYRNRLPSHRRLQFRANDPTLSGGDKARKRKKKKTGGFINVRIYAERKDVDHTHEIQCALTPDGGLNLASRVDVVPIFGLSAHCLPKVLDARYSRPWVGKHPVLERGAIKLLKAKEGYLRVVGQAPPPLRDQEPSRFPSWQS